MVSPQSKHYPAPFMSPNLQQLLKSYAPEGLIALSETDTRPYRNGGELDAASQWLTEKELQDFSRFSFDKRRSEWLSGRICAKQAVLELLNAGNGTSYQPHDIVIKTRDSGRPYLSIDKLPSSDSGLEISISHSHDMAVSIAAKGYCGIDIQLLNDTLFKVKPRYCSDLEAAILHESGVDELHQLGLLWVGKEAIRKSLSSSGLVGFLDIGLESIHNEQGYHYLRFSLEEPFARVGTLSVLAHLHGSYALAVCTISRDRLDA